MSRFGKRTRHGLVAALTLLVLSALTACIRMPTDGPVVTTGQAGDQTEAGPTFFEPSPPQPGESPTEIVRHFLEAMTATPIRTGIAREFLSEGAQRSWNPQQSILTYTGPTVPRGVRSVEVSLTDVNRLDARGRWEGAVSEDKSTITFPMDIDTDGQWRIAEAPDALIVPQSWFAERFMQVSLYFLDPAARILVPEPVFLPRDEQLPTALVRGLFDGPAPDLREVERSFLPPVDTTALSVQIDDGVASVAVSEEVSLTSRELDLAITQLSWTLGQVQGVSSVRLEAAGAPVNLPGEGPEYGIERGRDFDPAGFPSSTALYGLRNGVVVSGDDTSAMDPVAGPLGRDDALVGARSLSVSVRGDVAAVVSQDGTRMFTASVDDPAAAVEEVARNATDLLRPAWDSGGRLWLLDRTEFGAVVSVLRQSGPKAVDVPGVSGERVRQFLISRDGSRLVSVVRRDGGDVLLVNRVSRDDRGRVKSVGPARRLTWPGSDRTSVRGIAWQTPISVAVLYPLSEEYTQVRAVSVDGASTVQSGFSTSLRGTYRWIAGSPGTESSLLVSRTDGGLVDLGDSDRSLNPVDLLPGSLGYAG